MAIKAILAEPSASLGNPSLLSSSSSIFPFFTSFNTLKRFCSFFFNVRILSIPPILTFSLTN